jgi:hypothetical protein
MSRAQSPHNAAVVVNHPLADVSAPTRRRATRARQLRAGEVVHPAVAAILPAVGEVGRLCRPVMAEAVRAQAIH